MFDCDGVAGGFVEGAVDDAEGAAWGRGGWLAAVLSLSVVGRWPGGTYSPAPPAFDNLQPFCLFFVVPFNQCSIARLNHSSAPTNTAQANQHTNSALNNREMHEV